MSDRPSSTLPGALPPTLPLPPRLAGYGHPLLWAIAVVFGWSQPAAASPSDGILRFDLTPPLPPRELPDGSPTFPLLPVPAGIALPVSDPAPASLPPPPPLVATTPSASSPAISLPTPSTTDPALQFCAGATCPNASPAASPVPSLPAPQNFDLLSLFAGGEDSLVAIAVGNAEGTRTVEGHRTAAYWGHIDPGNGAWNLGSFSYQYGATVPAEADRQQLGRLQQQAIALHQQAADQGIELSLEASLNGIDLANQSPQAALSQGGFIDRLTEAYRMGLKGTEAIHWARVRSFLDPDTRQWNAPGLGNQVDSISRDQERRSRAIATVLSIRALLSPR